MGPIFLAFVSTDVADVMCKNVAVCFLTIDVLPYANSLQIKIEYSSRVKLVLTLVMNNRLRVA